MIELIFLACLNTAPVVCEQRSIGYLDTVGLMGCMMQAQPQLAEWSLTHPGHTVARWSCQYAERKAMDA